MIVFGDVFIFHQLDNAREILERIEKQLHTLNERQAHMAGEQQKLQDTTDALVAKTTEAATTIAALLKAVKDAQFQLTEIKGLLDAQTSSGAIDPAAIESATNKIQGAIDGLTNMVADALASTTGLVATEAATDATPGTTPGGDPIPPPTEG